jgi:hypothetical protein
MAEDLSCIVRSWQNNWSKVIPDVFVRAGNSESDLYDECDRIAEYDFTEGDQKPSVPVGQGSFQDSVSYLEKHLEKMDNADTELERNDDSIRDTF